MAKETSPIYVFFLTRKNLYVFSTDARTGLSIPVPETAIKDLDVKKITDIENTLVGSIQGKLTTGKGYLILGDDTIIDKTFQGASKDNFKEEIENQVKLAPFNHVQYGTQHVGKDLVLVLANREIYEAFQEILGKLGFHIMAVTPARFLGITQNTFDEKVAKEILRKTPLIMQNSFIVDPQQIVDRQNELSSDPRKNRKLLILLVAFAGLALVLGILLVKTVFFPDKPQVQNTAATPTPEAVVVTPTPVLTDAPVASNAASLENYKLQVLNGSGETGAAQKARDLLTSAGFLNVETGNSDLINSERIQIVFAPGIDNLVKEKIISTLTANYPNPAVREEPQLQTYDVVITLTAK